MPLEKSRKPAEESSMSNEDRYGDEFEAAFKEAAGTQGVANEPDDDLAPDEQAALEDSQSQEHEPDAAADAAGPEHEPQTMIAELQRERDEWRHRASSDAGRITAYQRQIDELQRQIESAQRNTGSTQEAREELAKEFNDSSWRELQDDFPEIAKALDSRLKKIEAIEVRLSGFEKKIQPIEENFNEQATKQEYAALEAAHPDWLGVARSESFRGWVNAQPTPVRELIHSKSAADAAYLLNSYKAMTGQRQAEPGNGSSVQQERNERLRQSVSVPSRRVIRREVPEDDFEAAFNAFARRAPSR